MPKEEQFPTLKMMRCEKCGNVFVQSFSGSRECPECAHVSTTPYRPDGKTDGKKKKG